MHLLAIDDLTDPQIALILDEGARWFAFNRQPRRNAKRLDGLTIINAFFEIRPAPCCHSRSRPGGSARR